MATFTNTTKNSISPSNVSKNTISPSNVSKSTQTSIISTGTPMGLLLALTYATDVVISSGAAIAWSNSTKS